jgi:hypothetical protein
MAISNQLGVKSILWSLPATNAIGRPLEWDRADASAGASVCSAALDRLQLPHGGRRLPSVAGRPLALLLGRGALRLGREAAALRALRGTSRSPWGGIGRERICHDLAERVERGHPVPQLRPLLRDRDRDGPRDQAPTEPREDPRPLLIGEHQRLGRAPRELHPAVRRVDVLPAGPGRPREPPAQLGRGDGQRGADLEIHAARVARRARVPRENARSDIRPASDARLTEVPGHLDRRDIRVELHEGDAPQHYPHKKDAFLTLRPQTSACGVSLVWLYQLCPSRLGPAER